MSETVPAPEAIRTPGVRHEESDVNVRGVLWTAGAMIVAAIVVHLAAWWVFDLFAAPASKRQPVTAPPRGGNLTVEQRLDKLRAEGQPPLEGFEREQERLAGKPDSTEAEKEPAESPEQGFAHIPIEQAMAQLVKQEQQKGGQQAGRRGGLDRPTSSNAGRGPAQRSQP